MTGTGVDGLGRSVDSVTYLGASEPLYIWNNTGTYVFSGTRLRREATVPVLILPLITLLQAVIILMTARLNLDTLSSRIRIRCEVNNQPNRNVQQIYYAMISIVIPTCKSKNLLPCLTSIREYTDDVEIIVVANGYDGEIPMGVIPILFKEMIGYPKAVNAGIRQARGEFIVLLNDDTILLPQPKNQWIELLREPFKDPDMAITGPWMMHNTEIQRDFICFFCCMIRKSVLDTIDDLDAATFGAGYCEDVDWCCRAVDAGYKMAQVPTSDSVPYDGKLGVGQFPMLSQRQRDVQRSS